jgi:tRNA threonylcarbamoyladenosine biosynthesis protein TsaE
MLPHKTVVVNLGSPEQTQEFGESLGRLCKGGETILLSGDLGAGKTCFTQGLARGLAIPPEQEVTSPTFVLHCEYRGRLVLNHIDLYRLGDNLDFSHTGFDELFGLSGAVCVVEWADLLHDATPHEHLGIHLEISGEDSRAARVCSFGERHLHLIGELSE